MFTKHFFKMLIVFSGMIILGLIGVFIVAHFDKTQTSNGEKSQLAE